MFSDELAGNASRRRQELSKARRRKLKEQKLKSQNKGTNSTTSGDHKDDDKINKDENIKEKDRVHAVNYGVKVDLPSLVQNSSKNSAVAKALDQRKLRSFQKLHKLSATTIQSYFRAYKSNSSLVKREKVFLEKRISDLVKLSQLLRKQNKSFAPPPSLVSLMVNQTLFVLHSTARNRKPSSFDDNQDKQISVQYFSSISSSLTKRDGENFVRLIENAILPGLLSSDEHLDPCLAWLQVKEGEVRLMKLLRLCCHLITVRQNVGNKRTGTVAMPLLVTEDGVTIIYKLLETVMGSSASGYARPSVVAFCKELLLLKTAKISSHRSLTLGQRPTSMETLDLLYILRTFLLYPSGKKVRVIPMHAERDRRECVSRSDRRRATGLFSLLSNLMTTVCSFDVNLKSRFVTEIYTVPLLTWRIEQSAIDKMVGNNKHEISRSIHPPFLQNLSALLKVYQGQICDGFATILPSADTPLNICPSPPELSLCANMACFATSSTFINGKNRLAFDIDAATFFFDFMSIIVNIVPLGAFSSRESEVGWIKHGQHLKPIVLSSIVREQCKLLLLDSFTREIFSIATDSNRISTDTILHKKNSKDLKLEEELDEVKSKSAVSVAAQEAMVNRSTGFWKKSNWAKQLKKVTSFLSNDQKSKTGKGTLMNTSELSRELAHGRSNDPVPDAENETYYKSKVDNFTPDFLFSISRAYATIASRWGGCGYHVILGCDFCDESAKSQGLQCASKKRDPCVVPFLNVLSFSTSFLKTSWAMIQSNSRIIIDLQELVDAKNGIAIRSAKLQPTVSNGFLVFENCTGYALLLLFNLTLAHTLIITDDAELHDLGKPMPMHQIRRAIVLLKNLLYRACCFDYNSQTLKSSSEHIGLSIISSSAKLLRDLYDRSSRRLLCPPKTWLINDLLEDEICRSKSHEDYLLILNEPVLKLCPFLVSFKRRLKIFERIIGTNKDIIQGRNDGHSFRPGIPVHIMRNRVIEDGLIHLNKLGSDLRKRIIVHYVNAAGATESGLDAGGLFKEFWTDLSNQSLNPNWALFRETEDGFLFPNPSSRAAHGSESIILFEFLGRILGKAIYEGITIQPQFAHFFLSFLRGDYNFLHMLADLSTMDNTLYNNLMFLKTYEGDAKDLSLSFAVAKNEFGSNEEIPLIPGGNEKDVTNLNKHHYVELVAKHYVCDQVKEQSEAFRRGLWDVIDRQWLRIFNEPELQVVISGATDGTVDIEDMKANTKYAGGYTIFDRNIHRFWKVVSSFSKQQRADLLRFVTSCERPPPLGFASMNPPFTIQRVPINKDEEKLPTSSTCFNILKLPTYSSERALKERLLYSIQSGSGFELT